MKNHSNVLVFLFLANLSLIPLSAAPVEAQVVDADECPLPKVEIPGEDIAGFPRYPNSVRVRFNRETERNIMSLGQRARGTEVSYRCNGSMSNILDFYNRQLTEKGWQLQSSNYWGEASIHMVFNKGEDSILFALRPHTTGSGLRRKVRDKAESTTPSNCFVIQVFLWNEKDAEPNERMSRPSRDKDQSARGFGR